MSTTSIVDVDGFGQLIYTPYAISDKFHDESPKSGQLRSRFQPRQDGAAPIMHVGGESFCCQHTAECLLCSSKAFCNLASPIHTSRCFCQCMSQFSLDKAYALEIQERDLTIDAYEVVCSMCRIYGVSTIRRDQDLMEIVFRYDNCVLLYAALREIDSESSAQLYQKLPVPAIYQFQATSSASTLNAAASELLLSSRTTTPIIFFSVSTPAGPEEKPASQSKRFLLTPSDPSPEQTGSSLEISDRSDGTRTPLRDTSIDWWGYNPRFPALSLRSLIYCPTLPLGADARQRLGSNMGAPPLPIFTDGWRMIVDNGRDIRVWFKMVPKTTGLLFRLDGMVATSLLNVISVMAQVEHTRKWVPSMTFPVRMGLVHVDCLARNGRFDKVSVYDFAMPWPFRNRHACVHGWLVDDLERNNTLTFSYRSLDDKSVAPFCPVSEVPPTPTDSVRVQFEGGATITPMNNDQHCFVRMLCLIDPKERLSTSLINIFAGQFMRLAFKAFRRQCIEVKRNPKSEFYIAQQKDPWLYGFLQQRLSELAEFRSDTVCVL